MEASIRQKTEKPPKRIETECNLKMVKEFLGRRFPKINFSFKINEYVLGKCLLVSWIDGPTEIEMEPLAKIFNGAEIEKDGIVTRRPTQFLMPNGSFELFQFDFDLIALKRYLTLPD